MHNLLTTLKASLLPKDWADRIQIWLAVFLQLTLVAILLGALHEMRWLLAFTTTTVILLTFLPALFEKKFDVLLPVEFTLATCLFLSASFGLGEVKQFYEKFWWWDLLLHSFAALLLGLVGFLFVYVFYKTNRIRMAPIYVSVITFGFAITMGTLWELFEFTMDWWFGLNMQKSGLIDTMTDLIVDAIGGLIAAWIGYQYVKDGDSLIADRIVRRFVEKNPKLFNHRSKS